MFPTISGLVDCGLARWSPGLGDPHVMGWVTVAVYTLASVAAGRRAVRGPFPVETNRRERLFWSLAAVTLVLLAANKQMDLQSLLTALGRCVAKAQGWYGNRNEVQSWFVAAVISGGATTLAIVMLMMRATFQRTGLALLGLGFVCIFVAVRAASFHHVDAMIGTSYFGLRMNWLLELPGPALVIIAAVRGSTLT